MKYTIRILVFLITALSASITYASSTYSVLTNIDCGGGQATCTQITIGSLNGGDRCTCTATCSSAYCLQGDVAATALVAWGTYAPPNGPCQYPVNGSANGGTQVGSYGLVSSVFATAKAVTFYSTTTVQSLDDCWLGVTSSQPTLYVYTC